jgi:hypothetical protein
MGYRGHAFDTGRVASMLSSVVVAAVIAGKSARVLEPLLHSDEGNVVNGLAVATLTWLRSKGRPLISICAGSSLKIVGAWFVVP